MRVGLMIPCYIDMFYPQVGVATLELLEKLGIEVGYPFDQTCCGQPMANSGAYKEAKATEELFIRNFAPLRPHRRPVGQLRAPPAQQVHRPTTHPDAGTSAPTYTTCPSSCTTC